MKCLFVLRGPSNKELVLSLKILINFLVDTSIVSDYDDEVNIELVLRNRYISDTSCSLLYVSAFLIMPFI